MFFGGTFLRFVGIFLDWGIWVVFGGGCEYCVIFIFLGVEWFLFFSIKGWIYYWICYDGKRLSIFGEDCFYFLVGKV